MENDNKEPSVADSIVAAFAEHDAASDAGAGAAAGTSAAAPAANQNTPPAKDAGAAPTGEKAPASAAAADKKDSTTSQADAVKAGADQPIAPPASWDAEAKANFAKLPPELQKVIAKREGERDGFVSKNGEELATYRKRFESLDSVIEPFRGQLARAGVNEAQYVGQLLALADLANRDFGAFITEQANLRNFDLKAMVASVAEKPYVDPTVKAMQDEIAQLKGAITHSQRAAVASTQQTIVTQIENFKNEKDASGNPLRPHYARLEPVLEPYILSIRQENPALQPAEVLAQAYDRAMWATPEMRGELIEQERKNAAATVIETEQQKAQKAREATVTHRGSPAGARAAASDESVEDTIRATFAQFGL